MDGLKPVPFKLTHYHFLRFAEVGRELQILRRRSPTAHFAQDDD